MESFLLPRLPISFDIIFIRASIHDAMASIGYHPPKPEQVEVVEKFLLRQDVLCLFLLVEEKVFAMVACQLYLTSSEKSSNSPSF